MDTAQLAAVAGGRRVNRSFAFIDLCGFTDFEDAEGDEAAVAEVQQLRSVVREVAPLFMVRVDKWLGDGVMLVSVESESIVAAVIAIEHRFRRVGRLTLRSGVASGDVLLLEGDDYIGRPVNVAARLCDHAQPGQTLADPAGITLPHWVHAAEHTTVKLKGVAAPVAVAVLEGDPAMVDPAPARPPGAPTER